MAVSDTQDISRALAAAVIGEQSAPSVAAEVRRQARQKIGELRLPGPKDEDFRFIRFRKLVGTDFVDAAHADTADVNADMVDDYAAPEADGRRLVFVNGQCRPTLSDISAMGEAVDVGDLGSCETPPAAVSDYLGQIDAYGDDYFANLNAAGMTDGAYVVVADDTAVDGPIQLLYLSTESASAFAAHPRNLVVVGRGAKASLIEDYVGPHTSTYFNNVVTEVSLGENATLAHTKVQRDSKTAFHISRTSIDLAASSTYNSQTISMGAALSRYDVWAKGAAEQIDCTLDGLAVLGGAQVSDTHTVMDHSEAHSGSHQLHKMVLDGNSHAVFNGKIFVRPQAQIIDAYQLNRTLLLSDHAKVNTKPQLEIFADDVKCTHGAAIGQLDDDQLFYLQSRGLDEAAARDLLVYGFAAEIIETIAVASIREALEDAVSRRTSTA